MEKTISSFYAHDHDELDGFLQAFQRLKKTDYASAKENFKKFKFGLQKHIAWEEEILFPLFEEKTGLKEGGPTEAMRDEHRRIKDALEDLHKKVQRQDPNSDSEELMLLALLHEHNEKEEHVLYPAIDRLASDEERKKIFGRMDALPEQKYKTCCGLKMDH